MDLRSQTSERKNKDAPNSCLGAVLISIPGAHRYTKWVETQGIQTSQTALDTKRGSKKNVVVREEWILTNSSRAG